MAAFKNKYFQEGWDKNVYAPGAAKGSSDPGRHVVEGWDNTWGTWEEQGGKYVVYDGKTNYLGTVAKTGVFSCNGELDEYKASFLRSAKEDLVAKGLVGTMSGDKV